MQGPQQPCQSTTLEQSANPHGKHHNQSGIDDSHVKHYDKTNHRLRDDQHDMHHEDQHLPGNDDDLHNKEKLQFTAESNLANGLCTGSSPGLMAGTSDGLCEGQKKVADDEPVLLGNDYNLEYDETEHIYEGDIFPGHLSDVKLRYLQKMYKAVPEEFYEKTKKAPVTPRNARSWLRKRCGSIFHLWEWCSGSGRLSLVALLSGLCILFPIDFRYGWDLA
eukprot:s172_g3.t1